MNKKYLDIFAKKSVIKPNQNNTLKVKRGIRFKLLVMTISLIFSLLTAFTGIQVIMQRNFAQEGLQSRISLINQLLFEQGKSISKLLAAQIEKEIATNNFSRINILIAETIKESIALEYAILTDLDGMAYVHTAKPELQQHKLISEHDVIAIQQRHATVLEYPEEHVIEYIKPISFGKPWGVLRLGFSLHNLQNEVDFSKNETNMRTHEILIASIAIALVFIFFATGVVLIISNTISRPLIRLTKFSQDLGKGAFDKAINDYNVDNSIDVHTEIGLLATSFIDMANEIKNSHEQLAAYNASLEKLNAQQAELIEKLRQNKELLQSSLNTELKLKEIASRFVPNEFLALLGHNNLIDVNLGDTKQQVMSVMFCDIRGFTRLSESMTPSENFKFISSYLVQMEPVISKHRGFIDKYIGDAIMALFSGSANDAVNAGIAMLKQLEVYNGYRDSSGYQSIKTGIGINTGSLILGTVGTEKRMDGTVISDAVNLSSRIETLTKSYNTPLLISHHTYASLIKPENYAIRMIDLVTVKGKEELVTVYEVFDADPEPIKAAKLSTLEHFTSAISAYNKKEFEQARLLFNHCLAINPDDNVCRIYLNRLVQ